MKFAVFTDLHIHPFARFSHLSKGGSNIWVENAMNVLRQIYSICNQRGVSHIISLGDLFHVGPRLYTGVFNRVYNFFQKKQREGFKTDLIVGNHDLVSRHGTDSALEALRGVVHSVVDQFSTLGPGVYAAAYTEDYQVLREHIEGCLNTKSIPISILLGHLAVEGAVVGTHEYQPETGCSGTLFKGLDYVFLGHYHKRQTLTAAVRYIGSAMSHDFNDSSETKGFSIIEVTEDGVREELIPLSSPGFLVCDAVDAESAHVDSRIVRVDYTGDLDEVAARKVLIEKGALEVIFNRKTIRDIEVRIENSEMGLPDHVQLWVDRAEERGDITNSQELKKIGLSIVRDIPLPQ